MIEKGIVIDIVNAEATVAIRRTEACATCNGCLLAKDDKPILLKIKSPQALEPGDTITFEINSRAVLSSGFLVFMAPLVMFIIGIFVGSRVLTSFVPSLDGNMAGILGGIVFLLVTVGLVVVIERRTARVAALSPRIIAVEKASGSISDSVGDHCKR